MNKSVMKCCICNNENIGQFITINNKKYHLCCIEQLQQENKKLNGAIQTYDILLKSNIEENKQLKDELKSKPDAQITLQDDKGNKFMVIQTERIDMQVELNKTIEKLFNNWNKLKEYIKQEPTLYFYNDKLPFEVIMVKIITKMQELEQGSDSNE